jgi:hypothetical protein
MGMPSGVCTLVIRTAHGRRSLPAIPNRGVQVILTASNDHLADTMTNNPPS